jgi:pyrophosphatase PpaX
MIKLVAFDLDGTLVNTAELSRVGFFEAAKELGFDPSVYCDAYAKTSGLPFEQRLKQTMPFILPKKDELKKAMIISQLNNVSIVKPYDGVQEMLKEINCKTAIITSRVWLMANKIIKESLGIEFDYILTPELTDKHKPSPEPIFYLANKFGILPSEIAIIGDSAYDIECGLKAGSIAIGAGWGFSSKKDLLDHKPHYIAKSPLEILSILKKLNS